jgi:glutathione-regulated potassium-efflux system protein KefB
MVIVFLAGSKVCPWLLRFANTRNMRETFTAIIFIAILGSAWIAFHVGLSMALGAFLMGVALSGIEQRDQLREEVMPFKNLLLGLFFVSVGLSLDVSVLRGNTIRILMHVLAIIVVKVAVLYLVARIIKMEHAPAARISFLLAQAGEFGFVILGMLLAAGVVTPAQFGNGIMVIGLTAIMTPWLDSIGVAWSRWRQPAIPTPNVSARELSGRSSSEG